MRSATTQARTAASTSRGTWYSAVLALLLAGAFSFAWLALSPPAAHAANLEVGQCNGVGAGPAGATTGMTCRVTVVNTINRGITGSTTTVTRLCSLDPCSPGNGTFTTQSTSLVTSVKQCNASDNDAAHPIRCDVSITNNVSADTPGAEPVTAATVNECDGSGNGGGGSVTCSPFPATTTGATVTQCNGSGNGGGGTVACTVATGSTVSPAVPITINQCNGTGNPGGSVVTCRTSITTHITALSPTTTPGRTASPAATAAATSAPTATGRSAGGPAQITRVPTGGVAAGGGSDSGIAHARVLALGGLLLCVAIGLVLSRRLVGGAGRSAR